METSVEKQIEGLSSDNESSRLTEFEGVLAKIGDFGKYQKKLIICFFIPSALIVPFLGLSSVFLSATPDHWCNVPLVANSNISLNAQQQLIRPKSDPHCTMYAVNYSALLYSGNLTIDESTPTEPCRQGWTYDTSEYSATAVTKWNMVCSDQHYSSLVKSAVFAGDIIGTVIFGYLCDM